jgi:muramoyltetrapeptide carboxypeptidase
VTIKPLALEPGQEIGIIAPAGPVNAVTLRDGLELLSTLGFKPILGSHLYNTQGYLAGSDISRLEDIHEMIGNSQIKAIFFARGGYGCMRLLDQLDYDLIRKNPKIIMGFSDITALLLSILAKTGLITFHGPVVNGMNKGSLDNIDHLMKLLGGKNRFSIGLDSAEIYFDGEAEGILVGGNLSLISHLNGTPYLPSFDGGILFIEEKNEAPYRLDRMLTHLRLSGIMKKIKGLIIGSLVECGNDEEIGQVLSNCLADMNIPIVYGGPFGHGDENIAIPIGVRAKLDTKNMLLNVIESPFQED